MLNERSANPGDLAKLEVTIDGKDVSAACYDAQLYFDLVGGLWSAKLFFEDSMNLLTAIPITSGKKVKIKAATNFDGVGDDEKTFEYEVFSVTDKQADNHMTYSYTVNCASQAFVTDQKTRVSKSFNGSAGDAVQSVVSDKLGASIRETRPSEGSVCFIASNWTPLDTTAWASKWATYKGVADFMLFQVDNNQFDFLPISFMYEHRSREVPNFTFIQRPAGMKENGEVSAERDPAKLFTEYQFAHFDAVRASLNGYFASTNVSFDFVAKKWKEDVYTNPEAEGAEGGFAGSELANTTFFPVSNKLFGGGGNPYDAVKDWSGSRRAQLMRLEREKLLLQTAANIGAWKWLGRTVKVDLPAMEDMTSEEFDKPRRGKYLVTAISLMLNKADAATNYELAKIRLEKA